MSNKYSKRTQSVHSGTLEDSIHKGRVSPIYPATAYDYIDVDTFAYPRYFNTPNQDSVAQKICDLENGEMGIIFGSGMAAITTVLFNLLKHGDHAVFQNDLYGGTYHAVTTEMEKFGIDYSMTGGIGVDEFEKIITPKTKIIYIETPSNPLLKIID
ncbi:MAG: aminotransferase class I/II-fold pyridoxal phosphate-dependent enzyme, partial [Bacteroidota bacterium]